MSQTAIGLFENSGTADQVVQDLNAQAFSKSEIRILKEPLDLEVTGPMSSPRTDFQVSLERELTSIGATIPEANAYAQGLARGGVIVLATGSSAEVDEASKIMNRRGALEVEEVSGRKPNTATMIGQGRPFADDTSAQTGRTRQTGGGARMFIW